MLIKICVTTLSLNFLSNQLGHEKLQMMPHTEMIWIVTSANSLFKI